MELIKGKNNADIYAISFWASLGSFFFLPVIFAFSVVGVAIFSGDIGFDLDAIQAFFDSESFMIMASLADVISKILPIVLIIVIFRQMFIREGRLFIINWKKNLLLIIGAYAFMYLMLIALNQIYIFFGIDGTPSNQEFIERLLASSMRPFMFVLVVFFAPFLEELIFRKFLIGYLMDKVRMSKWLAVFISAFVFAAIHIIGSPSDWVFIFQYLALAFAITIAYVVSGYNIYVAIAIHFINNLLSFLLA